MPVSLQLSHWESVALATPSVSEDESESAAYLIVPDKMNARPFLTSIAQTVGPLSAESVTHPGMIAVIFCPHLFISL